MSDTPTTEATASLPSLTAQEAPVETFSKEYVQELRNEAAKYRNEKKEAVEAAKAEATAAAIAEYEQKAALDAEHTQAINNELSGTKLELLKLKSVLAAEIPSADVLEVASLVQGSDEDTISQSVERVKALLGKAPQRDRLVDPSQGSGNVPPLNGDPLLETLRRIVSR
jgi:hypothetical protein